MSLRRLFRCAGGAPTPSPSPTPTPTPGIAALSPGASWNGTAGSGGTAPSADTDTQRINTLGNGLGWPDQPNIALNMVDCMTIEQAGGYTGFAVLEAGHDDGFDPCTIWCEGNSLLISPALIANNPDGKAQYGLWFQLTAPNGVGGLATVKVIARPKRGYEREFSVTVWLNDKGAVTRPAFYIDPAGSDTTGDGSLGNPWQNLDYAATHPGVADASKLTTGWRVICKSAASNYALNQGGLGQFASNTGPITVEANTGLSAGQVGFVRVGDDGTQRIVLRSRVIEFWNVWIECSANIVRAITPYSNAARGGNTIFRDGTRIYDTDGASGPLDHSYPAGFAPIGGGNFPRSHRFFDPDGAYTKVAFLGSATSKARMDLTHVSGALAYINFDCTYGWTAAFPRADARDSNFRTMNANFKAYGSMWFRNHANVTGTVVSVSSRVLNGVTVWDVVTDLTDLPNYPVDANGGTTLPVDEQGQHWMLAFAQGASTVAVGGGTQFVGTLGPQSAQNRDGTRDFPFYGWAIKGYISASKTITLNSQPVGLTAGDLVRSQHAHGNDQIFIQGDPTLVGNVENVTFYNTVMEAPEGYFISQQAGSRGAAGTGTCSFDGSNTVTFTSAQSLVKGDTITISTNASAIVRKVVSSTQVLVYDAIDGTGTPLRPFSGISFSGQSFYIGKSVINLAFVNTFTWGTTAGAQLGSGGFQGFFVRGSTLSWDSLAGYGIFFYCDPTKRPQTFFRSFSIANSYISGLTSDTGDANFQTGHLWARGNQYGVGVNRDTDGGGGVAHASFAASLAGTISRFALSAPIPVMPVDVNGATRVAGVSHVGAAI